MSGHKSTSPVIEMRDVAVAAMQNPAAIVVENVNWTVNAGDFWVIGGLHGAGKSDFLLMATGLMSPRRGSYFLFGDEMPIFDDKRLVQRLRLGLVFDGGQLFKNLTVAQNVALPLQYHRDTAPEEIQKRVGAILEACELLPWANSTPGAMGRNWQKRAGLARALALQPEILLLDNPLGGLDMRDANWWLGFLEKLSSGHPLMEKKTMTLVVTADNFRWWKERARQFAFLSEKQFIVIGERARLGDTTELLVKELLSETTFEA